MHRWQPRCVILFCLGDGGGGGGIFCEGLAGKQISASEKRNSANFKRPIIFLHSERFPLRLPSTMKTVEQLAFQHSGTKKREVLNCFNSGVTIGAKLRTALNGDFTESVKFPCPERFRLLPNSACSQWRWGTIDTENSKFVCCYTIYRLSHVNRQSLGS